MKIIIDVELSEDVEFILEQLDEACEAGLIQGDIEVKV